MNLSELKVRLAELEIRAKKSFGQNFLVNEGVIGKIVGVVRARQPGHLIEIGPGMGALTEGLRDLRPTLIELDRDLAEYWRNQNFQVVEGDALKMDWEGLITADTWLVSNLPYQISTHLVVDRCFGPRQLQGMVLMFQKEVAQRLTAEPRTSAYGLLSVLAQLHWDIKKVADASPKDFFPPPKIASRVLQFVRSTSRPIMDKRFLTFLKVAFAHRRKFLLRNLGGLGDKMDWPAAFGALKISQKARAEELSPAEFATLFMYSRQARKTES